MQFEQLYANISDKQKLKFLDAIIKNNSSLQTEFANFTQSEKKVFIEFPTNSFFEIVASTKQKYQDEFKTVDTENPDWKNYRSPHSGYIEDWEAYQYASEQEFEKIFEAFSSETLNKIIGQKPDELIAMLIGLYEATQDVEINDETGTFEDANEFLLSEHESTMNSIIEKLKLSAVSENTILVAIEMFFKYCDDEYPGNTHFVGCFEHLLIALAEKSSEANQILSIIDKSTVERQSAPELILLLNKNAGNKTEWLQSAIQFYKINNEVAKQLLQYYFEEDKHSFVQTASELLKTDKRFWAKFLKDYVAVELDKTLFFDTFYQLTLDEKEISHYNKIREFLSESDLNTLLEEFDWDKAFAVRILEVEKRYESIREIVAKNGDNWHYIELISPILKIYPDFCFQNIKNKAVATIENKRGRDVYERISSWLKLMQNIPGFETEKRELITQLYNHKPNLPALKDEMRRAGLIK